MPDIQQLQHPDYSSANSVWRTYREVMWAADKYITEHLVKLSGVEDTADYNLRAELTEYNAIVKRGVTRLINALSVRFPEIERANLTAMLLDVEDGANGGVDLKSSSLSAFMINLLEDLLITSRVAVFVDRAKFNGTITRAEESNFPIYLYKYTAESIWNWAYDETDNTLTAVLLLDTVDTIDDKGLTSGSENQWRLLRRDRENGIVIETIYNSDQQIIDGPNILDIPEIPLVIIDLNHSIVEDVYLHQRQAVNLASLEMQFCVNHTISLYVEQSDLAAEWALSAAMKVNADGEVVEPDSSHEEEVRVGNVKGRRYGVGMERPSFISPDPDILRAVMEKRKRVEEDAQKLLQQAVASLTVTRSSAESKRMDDTDFSTGLVSICNALEEAEKEIIRMWAMYEQGADGLKIDPVVKYPGRFDVHDDSQRKDELTLTGQMIDTTPSSEWRKILLTRMVRLYHRNGLNKDVEDKIINEIEGLPAVVLDSSKIIEDHKAGLVGDKLASTLRGYPENESEQAAKDHAERAVRILSAQMGVADAGARGVPELDPDQQSAEREKE